jgi:hypothetical protein
VPQAGKHHGGRWILIGLVLLWPLALLVVSFDRASECLAAPADVCAAGQAIIDLKTWVTIVVALALTVVALGATLRGSRSWFRVLFVSNVAVVGIAFVAWRINFDIRLDALPSILPWISPACLFLMIGAIVGWRAATD